MSTLDDIRRKRVSELRDELSSLSLDSSGSKPTLVKRLWNAVKDRAREPRSATAGTAQRTAPAAVSGTQTASMAPAAPVLDQAAIQRLVRDEIQSAMKLVMAPAPSATTQAPVMTISSAATQASAVTSAVGGGPSSTSATGSSIIPDAPPLSVSDAAPLSSGKRTFYATVSKATIEKVVTGQFVEFASLLPPLPTDAISQNRQTLRFDQEAEDGSLVLSSMPSRHSRKIHDLDSWLEAWTAYCAIFVNAHATRAHELFGYQHIILNAARKFKFSAVLDYDRAFRGLIASDPATRWDCIEQDLYTSIFDARSFRPFRASDSQSSSTAPVCHLFNRGTCKRSQCRYRHVCSRCNSATHNAKACKATV